MAGCRRLLAGGDGAAGGRAGRSISAHGASAGAAYVPTMTFDVASVRQSEAGYS